MREWRFENGKAKDCLLFDDTYALGNHDDFNVVILKADDKKYREISDLVKKGSFDYLCMWKRMVFPVNDDETLQETTLTLALKSRKEEKLVAIVRGR